MVLGDVNLTNYSFKKSQGQNGPFQILSPAHAHTKWHLFTVVLILKLHRVFRNLQHYSDSRDFMNSFHGCPIKKTKILSLGAGCVQCSRAPQEVRPRGGASAQNHPERVLYGRQVFSQSNQSTIRLFVSHHNDGGKVLTEKTVVCFCRSFIAAAEAKLKAELKSSYLTQLDRKRLTMCKQELVGKSQIHTNTHTTSVQPLFYWGLRSGSLSLLAILNKQISDL